MCANAQNSFAKMIPNDFRPAWITADSSGDLFIYGDGNYIVRMDINGNAKWRKKFPGLRTIDRLLKNSSGNLLVAYCRNDTAPLYYTHPGLMMLDSMGTVLWSKEDTSFHSHPTTRFKQQFLTKGNEIIWIQQSGADVHFFKIDYNGNIQSQHYLYLQMDHAVWAPDNYIYCASNSTIYNKVDTTGNIIWMKIFPAGDPEALNNICIRGNNIYLCGYLFPNYPSFYPSWPLIHKIDAAGNILSSTVIALHDTSLGLLQKILPVSDGGFIITSWRHMNRMVVIKTDSSFSQILAYQNINDVNQVHDAALTADGDFVLTAFHTDPQFTNKTLVLKTGISANLSPCFVPIAVDSVFNISSVYTFINSNTSALNISFIPSNIVDSVQTIVAQPYCITIDVMDKNPQTRIDIYPNPSSGVITISNGDFCKHLSVMIYDINGQLIFNSNFENVLSENIELNSLASGVYAVNLIADDVSYKTRVLLIR